MKTLKQINRLKKMHQLVKVTNTGTPKEFAKKLNISESQLYNILEDLKEKGFPIQYSRSLKSYVYNDYCELEVLFSVKLLTQHDKINIAGGSIPNFFNTINII